jgi:hypothetical protein
MQWEILQAMSQRKYKAKVQQCKKLMFQRPAPPYSESFADTDVGEMSE